jgi:YD repeat-containing protein
MCLLHEGSMVVARIQVHRASAPPAAVTGSPVSFDAIRDDGQHVGFVLQGAAIAATDDSGLLLTRIADGYQLIDTHGDTEIYDAGGKLLSVKTHAGLVVTLNYNSTAQLVTVEDNLGHLLTLGYDSQNRLANVTDHNSNLVQYGYDAYSRLQRVSDSGSGTHTYLYEMPYLLTGAIDASGKRYATWEYDDMGRVR